MDEEIRKQMSSTNKKGMLYATQKRFSTCGNFSTSNLNPMINVKFWVIQT